MSLQLSAILKEVLDGAQPVQSTQPDAPTQAQPTDPVYYDALRDYQAFEAEIARAEEISKKKLENKVSQSILSKQVVVRASKGTEAQLQKDYTITVNKVGISYTADKYFIILRGKDGKDYFVAPEFKIQILSAQPIK